MIWQVSASFGIKWHGFPRDRLLPFSRQALALGVLFQ
jgi:hypothetical protein